jgi:uncharacterized membrane protein YhaH (DUF805 family)
MLRDLILAFDRFVESPSPVDLLALAALAIPILMAARVLRRAGFSRWWALLVLVPVVNLIGLWLFAYVRWPAVDIDR